MKIALVADHVGPLSRSGEIDAAAVPMAAALADRRHEVTLWTHRAEVPAPAGVTMRTLPGHDGVRDIPTAAGELATTWAADRPDVVHALSWTAGLTSLSAGRDLDIPLVQTFGDLARPGQPDATARSRLEAAIARSARLLVAQSTAAAADLGRRVSRVAVAMIPCGVDVDVFRPAALSAQRPPGPPRVVALCPLTGEYGADMAVRALRWAPHAELTIVGGPPPADLPTDPAAVRLSEEVVRCRVTGRVHLTGAIPDADLAELLRCADLVVCPATSEPVGAGALAALACGSPVLATDVDALSDIIAEQACGELVPPRRPEDFGRALHDLLTDRTRLAGYRIVAADRALNYAWPRIASTLEAAYHQTVSHPSRAAV